MATKGTIVFGLTPEQSAFYTAAETVVQSGGSTSTLNQSLQIQADRKMGYRPDVTAYVFTEDAPVASGQATANPQFGVGNGNQFVIPNYQLVLKPLYTEKLNP